MRFEETSLIAQTYSFPSPVQCSVMSASHNSFGPAVLNSCRTRPLSSTTAHRSLCTGGSGFLPFFPRFFSNADHQPRSEQVRHAVRSAIGSPASRASSTKNR